MGEIFKAISSKTGRPRRYTLESVAEVYNSGVSAAETGRLLGLHHTTVLYALKQMGIERRKRTTAVMDLRRERAEYAKAVRAARAIRDGEICALYGKGLSAVEIGRRLNITGTLIYGVIKRKGIPARPHGGPRVRLSSGPKPPRPAAKSNDGFVNYAEYRSLWRDAQRVEQMMQIFSKRKTRLCA